MCTTCGLCMSVLNQPARVSRIAVRDLFQIQSITDPVELVQARVLKRPKKLEKAAPKDPDITLRPVK